MAVKRTVVGVIVVALLLVDAGSSQASVSKERIGICEIHGTFLGCDASGKAEHPRQLRLRLWSNPSYPFSVDWTTLCFKWSGHRRREDHFNSDGERIDRRIEMAYWRPDRCRVKASITGGFGYGGIAKLILSARI
jgi:hypothetical protein